MFRQWEDVDQDCHFFFSEVKWVAACTVETILTQRVPAAYRAMGGPLEDSLLLKVSQNTGRDGESSLKTRACLHGVWQPSCVKTALGLVHNLLHSHPLMPRNYCFKLHTAYWNCPAQLAPLAGLISS